MRCAETGAFALHAGCPPEHFGNEQPYLNVDARPYGCGSDAGNRVRRANASRREFIADGLPAERIARVVGLADQEPLVPDDPTSPRNRRISIVLLRTAKEGAAGGSSP